MGSFGEVYGPLGAVVVSLMWIWLSALVVIVGAHVDAELEYQTAVDSTIGPERPMGERGAYVADHVAPSPDEDPGRRARFATTHQNPAGTSSSSVSMNP